MGLFTKRERIHVERNEEGEAVFLVDKEPHGRELIKKKIEARRRLFPEEDIPLTREEQFEPRVQPWRTERGQRIVKGMKKGFGDLDKRIVMYNRRSNMMNPYAMKRRRSSPSYGFGSMPTITYGLGSVGTPRRSTKKSSQKYAIVNNKAYPIARSSSKKKKTSSKKSSSYNLTDNWGLL